MNKPLQGDCRVNICVSRCFSVGEIMKNCTACRMEHHQVLRFLSVRGLTIVFVVCGLGVEDKQYVLLKVPILLHVIFLVGFVPRGCLPMKTKNRWCYEQQIEDTCVTIPLDFFGENCPLYVIQVAEVYTKCRGLC